MATRALVRTSNERSSEEIDVLLWRLEQFRALGFGEAESFALSKSPVDLGTARRLREAKCPRDIALRILL
jgi:hypothetical protein